MQSLLHFQTFMDQNNIIIAYNNILLIIAEQKTISECTEIITNECFFKKLNSHVLIKTNLSLLQGSH